MFNILNPSSVRAVILGWFVVAFFRFAHHMTYNFPKFIPVIPVVLYYTFDAVRWSAFTLLTIWFVQRRPAATLSARQLWTVVAPFLLLSVWAMLILDAAVFSTSATPLGVTVPGSVSELLQKRFHRMLLDVTTVLIIAYGINIVRALAAEELHSARLEAAVTESRLTALRQQLHPHLLFNTLNSISALIRREPEAAERMLARLSDLFRAILRVGNRSTIPLREDVAFAEAFLRIQEYRFPQGLRADTNIPASLLDAAVPALLLQPLVENSVKHGLEGMTGGAVISIVAIAIGSVLVLQVHDPGLKPAAATAGEGFGVGLSQMRERLQRMYGADASIALSSSAGGGTTVTVRLPLQVVTES